MKNNNILITIIVAIVIGAGAFFGGMKYQESKSPQISTMGQQVSRDGTTTFAAGGNARRGAMTQSAMNMTRGEVLAADDSSITLKLQDGSSKIINLSGKTVYTTTTTGSKADAKVGETIMVVGQTASDGSVSAENISIGNVSMGIMRGGPNMQRGQTQPAAPKQ